MPVNYTGSHELLKLAREAVLNALEQYTDYGHRELNTEADPSDKMEALAYAFSECLLIAMDTDDFGKAMINFQISTATQLAYLDSITQDSQEA
jgi:hypothetical protein